MPRKRSPNRDKACEIYKEHGGKITNREIANLLGEDEKVVAVWKSRDKWNDVQQSKKSCTTKREDSRATKTLPGMVHRNKIAMQKNMVFFGNISRKRPFLLFRRCR